MKVPTPKKELKRLTIHQDTRKDNYFWMNQRDTPEVIDYLKSENDYYEQMTRDTKTSEKNLFEELKSRIKEKDESVPFFYNDYWYQIKYKEGGDYPYYVRKKKTIDAKEEILLDCNDLAKEHKYFHLGEFEISPDNRLMAYSIDTTGRRIYTIYIKNLQTRELLKYTIADVSGNMVWANDNKTLFYVLQDSITLRAHQIKKHLISYPYEDVVCYEENDETFNVYLSKTKTEKYILFGSQSTMTSEAHLLTADFPNSEIKLFQNRIRGVEYSFTHHEDNFFILTNADQATNFKIVITPENKTDKKNWKDFIPHRDNVLIEDLEVFKHFLIINEKENGLNKIRVINLITREEYYIPFNSETYTIDLVNNYLYDTKFVRYIYSSMTTPSSVIEFNLITKESKVLKETEVLDSNFNKTNYKSERIWATAKDAEQIPISLVYRSDTPLDGTAPLLIYGYGSYGYTINPAFSSNRLSLLDRGFIFAIAHIRGGEYLGREWYEKGKLLHKTNTFYDFICCTKHLISNKYTSEKHCYAMGGSAGGLLMGTVINIAPKLYNGVIVAVPFVDVITTMLDSSIPLTTGEYDEWGNPNEEKYYHYMKSYSPYDNVSSQEYPNILVTTAYYDSQVQYWEPAKWVAKLRELKTDNNTILFQINMNAGHSGASGRFEALKELAKEYMFLLKLENIILTKKSIKK